MRPVNYLFNSPPGKSFQTILPTPCSAVERQFEIIGEALAQVLRLDPSLRSRISDSGRIIAFRNRLIHGYSSVSDDVVWGILEANLPSLQKEVAGLMKELNKG